MMLRHGKSCPRRYRPKSRPGHLWITALEASCASGHSQDGKYIHFTGCAPVRDLLDMSEDERSGIVRLYGPLARGWRETARKLREEATQENLTPHVAATQGA